MKNIFIFLLTTIITLLSGFFIYQSYLSYKSYQIAQNADVYLPYIKNTNEVLKKIEQECALSAFYLAKDAKVDFSQMQSSRDETDNAIKNSTKFIEKSPKFLSNLQYVRSRVDVASSDYKDIIFTYYQNELSNTLLKEIDENIKELSFGVSNLKQQLNRYSTLITKRNNISKEKSFITYILTTSKKMDKEDMNFWDKMLSKKEIDKSSLNDRVSVTKGITSGNYEIDLKSWLENSNRRIIGVMDNEEKVYNFLISKVINKTSAPQTLIYNVALSLLLLSFLYYLFRLQKINSIKKEFSKDIIKKIDINKNRITDKQNSEISAPLESPREGQRATDIPLTNSLQNKVFQTYTGDNGKTIQSFNPMEEFAHIINNFIEKTSKKNIGFKYTLDQTIPTYCIGDINKIHEAFHFLTNYAIKSSNSRTFLTLNIENIAQTKMESAIRFSLNQSNTHINNEEIKQIHDAKYDSIYKSLVDSAKLSKAKINLLKVSNLTRSMDGGFQIKNDENNSSNFQITLNLRRK